MKPSAKQWSKIRLGAPEKEWTHKGKQPKNYTGKQVECIEHIYVVPGRRWNQIIISHALNIKPDLQVSMARVHRNDSNPKLRGGWENREGTHRSSRGRHRGLSRRQCFWCAPVAYMSGVLWLVKIHLCTKAAVHLPKENNSSSIMVPTPIYRQLNTKKVS